MDSSPKSRSSGAVRRPRRSIGSTKDTATHAKSSQPTVAQVEAGTDDSFLRHVNVVGLHDPQLSSAVNMRDFDERSVRAEVLEFSEYSSPDAIRQICHGKIPGWSSVPLDHVCIKQVTEGLTNQIFKVYLEPADKAQSLGCVLFRIYGTEMKEFIDPVVELRVFEMLSKYEIAPKLVCRGTGWRIEEWHFALPLPTRVLPNPSIYCQVASQLGRFHKICSRPDFPREDLIARTPCVLEWLDKWAYSASQVEMVTREWKWRLDAMVKEAKWLGDYISEHMASGVVSGQGWDVVFCHNDCQENNLLQTQYGLRLIDFEYSHFNFQAYDIANFFNEFCIDYIVTTHPFFVLDLTRYPTLADQRMFAAVYLSEYLKTPVRPTDYNMTDPLIEAIELFSMASNLVWALWSVLRSPQALTFDDFDFMAHGAYRFDMYKRAQRKFLSNTRITSTDNLGSSALPVSVSQASLNRPAGTQRVSPEPRRLGESSERRERRNSSEWKWLLAGIVVGGVITTELFRLLKR